MATLRTLRNRLRKFHDNRALLNDLKDNIVPTQQAELVVQMKELDPEKVGIVVPDIEDDKNTAFWQQNEPTQFWDQEKIMEWLRQQPKSVQMSVTSRVFDPAKWEAEVANKNLPTKVVNQFKKTGTVPVPFIRWGKPNKNSIK